MATESIAVTPDARRALLEAAAGSGKGQVQLASEALVAGLRPGAAAPTTPDDAAEVILRHLAPSQQDFIRQLCKETNRKPLHYLLGYAAMAHERGETAFSMAEDDYRVADGFAKAQVGGTGECAWCQKAFVVARAGQKYCPDTDDPTTLSCGKQAAVAEIRKRRPEKASREREAAMRGARVPVDE